MSTGDRLRHMVILPALLIGIMLFAMQAYAADDGKASLYFYTVDGDEIEKLHKTISPKKEYEFKDPDQYKYMGYKDGDGNVIYPDEYYQVKGLYWQEVNEDGKFLKEYYSGDKSTFKSGDHFFYVKTDNPILTGENQIHFGTKDRVYLHFETPECFPIDELDKVITKADYFTFPDPNDYLTVEGENGYGYNGTGKGIYWATEDSNGKKYLFESGEKVQFKGGDYTFRVITDDPITVTFRYPMQELMIGAAEGDVYAQTTCRVGDTIHLMKSLGAIVWGCTFKGWEETNYFTDKVYKPDAQVRVMDSVDLDFYAVYEEDENWDPEALDLNTKSAPNAEAEKKIITVDVADINDKGGTGYDAYISDSGKVGRNNGEERINEKVVETGRKGDIKGSFTEQDANYTSQGKGTDAKDTDSYKKDKYGRSADESNISDTINGVLKQDDSAYYMDVYGNSMIYHSKYSRLLDMAVAYKSLSKAKNASFATMVSLWGEDVLDRYEAIEFALLSGQYPGDTNSWYKQFNSNTAEAKRAKRDAGIDENAKLPEWKDEYLSRESFFAFRSYKQLWHGWYDEYDNSED